MAEEIKYQSISFAHHDIGEERLLFTARQWLIFKWDELNGGIPTNNSKHLRTRVFLPLRPTRQ